SGFRSRKISQRDCGNAQKQKCVEIVRVGLQLALEFLPGLRIGFFAAELKNGVAKKAMGVGVFRIKLDSFAKFGDRLLWKMRDGVCAAKQYMQSSRIFHGSLDTLEPLLGVGQAFGFEVGNA